MSIESVIRLIKEKNQLEDKLTKEGNPFPVAESFKVYGQKISDEIKDTFPESKRSYTRIKDTQRMKAWRAVNKEARKAQNRRYYEKRKAKTS